jgi:NifU-like protein involved in Fe-S cluster formation
LTLGAAIIIIRAMSSKSIPNNPPPAAPDETPVEYRPSEAFILNAMQPQNLGFLPQPDGVGAPVGSCGDQIEIGIKVIGDVINQIAFFPQGCAATVAVGSAVTQLAQGLTVDQARELTAADVADFLGGLPPGHGHCAKLGIATLRAAVRDWQKHGHEAWKNLYRRPPGR